MSRIARSNRCACLPRLRCQVLWLPERQPSRFPGSEYPLGPAGDQLRFSLSDGRHDMNGQVVGLGHVDSHEFHAGLHQGSDHCDIAGEPVELGDQQDTSETLGLFESRFELRAPPLLGICFYFGELGAEDQVLAAGVDEDGRLLGFEAQATLALFHGGDSVVDDGGEAQPLMLQCLKDVQDL